eukprot:g217.t3
MKRDAQAPLVPSCELYPQEFAKRCRIKDDEPDASDLLKASLMRYASEKAKKNERKFMEEEELRMQKVEGIPRLQKSLIQACGGRKSVIEFPISLEPESE